MKSFVIDISRCNGCYDCQIAYKDGHVTNDWTLYAKPQPDSGQLWLKMGLLPHPLSFAYKSRVYFPKRIHNHQNRFDGISAAIGIHRTGERADVSEFNGAMY